MCWENYDKQIWLSCLLCKHHKFTVSYITALFLQVLYSCGTKIFSYFLFLCLALSQLTIRNKSFLVKISLSWQYVKMIVRIYIIGNFSSSTLSLCLIVYVKVFLLKPKISSAFVLYSKPCHVFTTCQ